MSVTTQFRKGALDMCVLYILQTDDFYGYDLTQQIKKTYTYHGKYVVSTFASACERWLLRDVYSRITNWATTEILSYHASRSDFFERDITRMG